MMYFAFLVVIVMIALYFISKRSESLPIPDKPQAKQILNENIDWLQERWKRADQEQRQGTFKTFPRWYFESATEDQIDQIGEMGLDADGLKLTNGQASDIIGLFESADEKDLALLQRHKVPLDVMNKTRAREQATKILLNHTYLKLSNLNPEKEVENKIIRQYPQDFIHFILFYLTRTADMNEPPAEFIPAEDQNRPRYEQAAELGFALKGGEIPTLAMIEALNLTEMSALVDEKGFNSRDEGIDYLKQLPDIQKRLNNIKSEINWYQLKKVKLDINYLHQEWTRIHGSLIDSIE
jgi:hypothetical protein